MIVTQNDIISFLLSQLDTEARLTTISFTGNDDQEPQVKEYGAHIYMGEEEPVEREARHIGPHLTETWSINLDIIIKKKSKTPRDAVSDPYGTSYWIKTITNLLLNKKNNGMFKWTRWNSLEHEEINSGIKIKGLFNCEILNTYT